MRIICSFLLKWPRIHGSSPLGIHFGRRKGIFVLCLSQPRSNLPWQPSSEVRKSLVPLFPLGQGPARPGPWHPLPPCVLSLAVSFPSHFKLSQWLESFNYSKALLASETSHMLFIFLECSPLIIHLFIYKNWPATTTSKKTFPTLPPSLVFARGTSDLLLFSHCYHLLLFLFVSSTGLWLS